MTRVLAALVFIAASSSDIPWPLAPVGVTAAKQVAGQAPVVPQPQPFPGRGPTRPSDQPAARPAAPPPTSAPQAPAAPAVAPPEGLPIYPTAEFIDAFDAGLGQRYYIYGTDRPYDDIVAYYRTLLKNGGRELFREPPTRQFELGRYNENAMAYPPSVVVKDYGWNGAPGYLAVSGTAEKRYRTVIQIVPATAAQ
jgi:hypothetical protein